MNVIPAKEKCWDDMTFAINVLGWIGVAALLSAYWLVSTQKATGNSRTYQGMNLLGATLVLVNSLYYGAYPSVGVNAAWIAIGAYTLAKHGPSRMFETGKRFT